MGKPRFRRREGLSPRDGFVRGLGALSKEFGLKLPKGASEAVLEAGRELVGKHGREALNRVAKLHFRTTQKVLGDAQS